MKMDGRHDDPDWLALEEPDYIDEGSETEGPTEISLIISPEEHGQRLDRVLASHLSGHSRMRIQRWIEQGHVSRTRAVESSDLRPVRPASHVVEAEEYVLSAPPPEAQGDWEAEPIELPVVYQDDAIWVINKPAGLVVHPAAGHWSGTLLNGLLALDPPLREVPRAGIVHRLDRETSGLMVVARSLLAQTELVRQLQARTVFRRYLALVWGIPRGKVTLNAPIGRDPRDRQRMSLRPQGQGREAITHVLKGPSGELLGKPVSVIACRLETGRTHQIRVHLQAAGHPLVGDPDYGRRLLGARLAAEMQSVQPGELPPTRRLVELALQRQALHAQSLGLNHPSDGRPMRFESALPEDFRSLLEQAGVLESTERWLGAAS